MMNLKKILLSLGAAAAVAALATGGTFAVFTDSDAIGENNIDSGTVSIALDGDDPVIDVSDMVIGDSKSGTLTVTNDGANKATYTLTGDSAGDEALESAAHITINDGTSNVVNDASLATFNDGAGVQVVLSPGGTASYTVDVSLPTTESAGSEADDDDLQGLSLVETFNVDAVQRAGVDRDTDSTPED